MNLNTQILIAAVLGVIYGFFLTLYPQTSFAEHSLYGLGILSSIFIGLLKMLLIPLIFSSIVVGVSNLQAGGQFGRVWKITALSCLTTTTLALILGISCAHLFEVGKGVDIQIFQEAMQNHQTPDTLTPSSFLTSFIQNTLIFGMIAISLLMYFWYWAYKVIKKSKETITSQHAQLQILNNANENLIYSLSHDIKEPLLGVLLLLQKLKIEDPFLSQASAALENQVNAVNIIVNNLLQNKINNNGPNSNCNLQEINETIDSVIKSLNYSIKEKNITINNKLQDQIQDITLKISKQKLYLILLNVISNSIKHSDDFQSIDIFSENNSILLRDYGKGIAKDILARIADNKMVPQTDKAVSGSTGLGLYLIKNLLQDTDVKMTIQNADGRGTIVAIG